MTQACFPCFSYHLKNEQVVPNTYDKFQGLHPDKALCTWLQNETYKGSWSPPFLP